MNMSDPKQQQQQKIHVGAAVVLLTAIFYAADFGFVSILVVIGSLLAGILFAKWVFECSNGEMLYQWKDYFNPSATTSSRKPEAEEADDDDDDARLDSEKTRRMPWQGLSLPASLNEAVENLLNEIVEQYVNGWYGGAISRDRAFINEIRQLPFPS
uniref:PXA domain-containing protein n=1 Tax=Caenorhabditis elegans TaxID=6239 RepID=Q8I0Z4_CAEEL|eukprot:NP_871950.1 Sorting NeXin [Caenorhabditis elegans]